MASTSTLPRLALFEAIQKHDPKSIAIVHCTSNRTFRYGELLGDVRRARDGLLKLSGKGGGGLDGERVAFLVENSYDYLVTLLAVIAAKAIAVPLSPAFPAAELQYIVNQSGALVLASSSKFLPKAKEVLAMGLSYTPQLWELQKHLGSPSPSTSNGSANSSDTMANGTATKPLSTIPLEGDAGTSGMMLYTSGTTSHPKGVLLPTATLTAQCTSLLEAWGYTPTDHLLHVLPLHHIHGTINALLTPLFAGSTVEFLFPFNADTAWRRFAAPFLPAPENGGSKREKITFFTVVPTVYTRLLSTFPTLPTTASSENNNDTSNIQAAAKTAISPQNLRLNISGSAALPTPLKKAWTDLSGGNVLLERYGMTEVGMALSCGLSPPDRVDGSVGWPLPTVQARLTDLDTNTVIHPGEEIDRSTGKHRHGEIQLRGPTIFKEYWDNPLATASEFTPAEPDDEDQAKWFKTGDVAERRFVPKAGVGLGAEKGGSGEWAKGQMLYFIQGRKSADIIKSGGEKVSALEVERELLSLPQVAEAAVVAVPSGKWGQKVGCVIVLKENAELGEKGKWTPMDMRRALRGRLVAYKIPQVMRVVDTIRRNAMGKVNKKVLVKEVFEDDFSGDEM